jgi:hypothetical protein
MGVNKVKAVKPNRYCADASVSVTERKRRSALKTISSASGLYFIKMHKELLPVMKADPKWPAEMKQQRGIYGYLRKYVSEKFKALPPTELELLEAEADANSILFAEEIKQWMKAHGKTTRGNDETRKRLEALGFRKTNDTDTHREFWWLPAHGEFPALIMQMRPSIPTEFLEDGTPIPPNGILVRKPKGQKRNVKRKLDFEAKVETEEEEAKEDDEEEEDDGDEEVSDHGDD